MEFLNIQELLRSQILRSKKVKHEILANNESFSLEVSNKTYEDPETGLTTEITAQGLKIGCGHIVYDSRQIAGECYFCRNGYKGIWNLIKKPKVKPIQEYLACIHCLHECICGKKLCSQHGYYAYGLWFCKECFKEFLDIEKEPDGINLF